jgi:thiamine-monophosphate kinase
MGPGGEFDTIRMLMSRWGDLAVDIGDDAAVLPAVGERTRLISTDACVEGAHFIREWLSPFEVGVRAAAAALSDLAAMGAQADAVLFALSVPDAWRPLLGELADGLASVVRTSGARIVGGNLTRADVLSITTTVVGSAQRVVARRGATIGDVLVVTGRLGGPGAALRAWTAGGRPSAWSRERFVAPVPRLAEGAALATAGATAMLDISDGLAADARHLAAASGVRLTIEPARLPVGEGTTLDALASGEEYELLAALPPQVARRLLAEWPGRFAVPLTAIGVVTAAEVAGALDFGDGSPADAGRDSSTGRVEFVSGHDHFSG